MKKNNTHDYATAAFIMYGKAGRPDSGVILNALRASRKEYLAFVKSKHHSKIKARHLSSKTAAIRRLYLDVRAIEQAILAPETEADELIYTCVSDVYFTAGSAEAAGGKKANDKGRISGLVINCALSRALSEASVYNYLSRGADKFCICRGLRRDNEIDITEILKM